MTDSHPATVAGTRDLTPHLRRVTLTGEFLRGWHSTGKPDEFVHVHIPDDTTAPGWNEDHLNARHYTVRRWNPQELTIDIDVVTHGHGRGATWARTCAPGDVVAISAPHGYYSTPEASTKRLLMADATGIPAVARILEEASPDEEFEVVIELIDLADRIDFHSAATVDCTWRVSGNGRSPSALEASMSRRRVPSGDTYVWIACETAESRRARGYLRSHWQRHHTWYRIVGYWHLDQEAQLARWMALTPEQQRRYSQIWDENRPDEENWVELEPFLREVGL